jgi:2-iminoacetate synthase
MKQFKDTFDKYQWDEVKASIQTKTSKDVETAMAATHRTPEDFKALISPAALPYLEQMAQLSHQLTQKRFGKTIQLFAPIYLSNKCNNICTYCGFSADHKIKRITLTAKEILQEIKVIKQYGYNHILLVTGESGRAVHVDYFLEAIDIIRPHFANISLEVQPLSQEEYTQLQHAGIYSVLVYQETYNKEKYKDYHLKGKKADFYNRLETPDRIGRAGMHKIGLGVLLGLEDWRTDSFFCALHLNYLQKTYWQSKYSIAFPRIRPAEGVDISNYHINDKELVQLLCAYRLLNEDLEISISTRESEVFRDHLIKLGTTSMSAGSKTNPGGYSVDVDSLEQFEINDARTPEQVAAVITANGYEPVWKDWETIF